MKFTFDDGGRSTSKRPRQKSDCVVRAFAHAAGLAYDEAYEILAKLGRKSSRGTNKKLWQTLFNSQPGLTRISFPAVAGQPRMSLAVFCRENRSGDFVVQLAGHLTYVSNGVVLDTFAPRQSACVYAVWEKTT